MASLALKSVNKSFGSLEVIKNVDLEVSDGEFVVFVGPSGCGKSTLLRMIAGLEDITGGELHIDGKLCNEAEPRERGIAMVFQSYALYPHLTVYDNMAFGLSLNKTPKAEVERRVQEAARILQLEHLLDRKPSQLSGGQRQRVAIGRAIIRKPAVFLFDEPLSNLDAALRMETRVEIARLHRELGATMIYVTHDQVEAMTLADKIVVLEGGVVRQIGTPMEIYKKPANQFVAGFIGSPRMNFLDVRVDGVSSGKVDVSSDILRPIAVDGQGFVKGDKAILGIRPQYLKRGEGVQSAASLGGVVTLVERLGTETIIGFQMPSGENICAAFFEDEAVELGSQITCVFDPAQAVLFPRA
ncbi:sn-glycerol-3-phosphate ABC transporter ATP-binding protein UgpC [Neorhizobium sp. AL 9.2.2]|uniref:ABC transporter ATP-binding protein n=1 Tax=Neorhizobium sp. AL 9.2.2 TaxID=2712894 RepID=UPI001572C806|nr:sn-glycerol-3-phosphate ABC transporter ATP-binding protein UgpC [Neorhizobium sp. AL 9.2.2]